MVNVWRVKLTARHSCLNLQSWIKTPASTRGAVPVECYPNHPFPKLGLQICTLIDQTNSGCSLWSLTSINDTDNRKISPHYIKSTHLKDHNVAEKAVDILVYNYFIIALISFCYHWRQIFKLVNVALSTRFV